MEKLPVPENIPLRWEAWRGFGRAEALRSAVVTGAAVAAAAIWYAIEPSQFRQTVAVVAVLLVLALCVGFFGKMDLNQSMFDHLTRRRRYRREQQVFRYKTGKETLQFYDEEKES